MQENELMKEKLQAYEAVMWVLANKILKKSIFKEKINKNIKTDLIVLRISKIETLCHMLTQFWKI